ncbi:NnrU family protein [Tateyamaria sp.]|uniref:NnrU family protein n=1 Tax=Tateyamaria sp. TaxID=1929288 RepID=UPI0032959101
MRPAVKAKIASRIGARGFTFGYSAVSLIMLGALIWAAGRAPFVLLWPLAIWHKYVVLLGMLGVCLLLALSIGRPNPFSFGGAQNHLFDAERPGIIRWMRHPLLVALALWAGLHILPNGNLAHVILFGVFLCFALSGQRIIDRRKRRQMGNEAWHTLLKMTMAAPLWQTPQAVRNIGIRLFAGSALWGVLVIAHPSLIGVSSLP